MTVRRRVLLAALMLLTGCWSLALPSLATAHDNVALAVKPSNEERKQAANKSKQ